MTKLSLTKFFAIFLLVTVNLMMMSEVVNSSRKLGEMVVNGTWDCWWDLGCANGKIDTRCKRDCKKKHGPNAKGICHAGYCCCYYETCYIEEDD